MITVFSDLHIHNYKTFDKDGSRLDNTLKVLEDIFDFNEINEIKYILFCGDLYDRRNKVPTVVFNKTIEKLNYLFNKYPKQQIIAISGNHDHAYTNTYEGEVNYISSLFSINILFDNFKLIDNKCINLSPYYYDKIKKQVNVYGIPYYEYKEDFIKKLEELNNSLDIHNSSNLKRILLIHQTPQTDSIFHSYDFSAKNKLFDKFDMVFCGHIHKRENLTNNFNIVGSPLHKDLKDEGEIKGFYVYDIDNNKLDFKPLNYPQIIKETNENKGKLNYENDYIIPLIESVEITDTDTNDFSVDKTEKDLVIAYWKQSEKKDDDKIIEKGLSLL